MSTVIKSGSSGYTAEVDSENRFSVRSDSYRVEESYSDHGRSYLIHGVCHLAAATSGAFLYLTPSDQSKHFHITRIYIDAQTLSNDIIVYQIKNPTTITGGTAITPVNKNYTSTAVFLGTFKMSDSASDITYTGGTNLHAYVVETKKSYMRDMVGSNLLQVDNTLLFGWATLDGGAATDGQKISFTINGYLEEN